MPSSGTKCPTKMSYENVLRRFGDFCIIVEAVLCTAQRLNINPCLLRLSLGQCLVEVVGVELRLRLQSSSGGLNFLELCDF